MEQFINKDEAIQFCKQIEDPIVRELVMDAYGTLIFKVAPVEVKGQFDLLFFFKVMEAFLRDRETLAEALRGESEDEVNGSDAGAPSASPLGEVLG